LEKADRVSSSDQCAEQDAGPNDEERDQPRVPITASVARSSSSVSFPLGRIAVTLMTTALTSSRMIHLYSESLNLLKGNGVAQDERRAFILNVEAAEGGHADAVLAMGWFYLNGVGVERDVKRARKWYRESARRGEPKAMFSLGQIAYDERDFSDALMWFTRAAEAGHARSLYWLGKLYWRGQAVDQDQKQAMRHFHSAAMNKVREAQRVLRFLR
jgi:TPR repeat protein